MSRAKALHKQSPLIDGHNDYPWEVRQRAQGDLDKVDIAKSIPTLMTDIPRLREGGVGAQFWSVYTPSDFAGQKAVTATMEQIDVVHRMVHKWPQTFELALTAGDVERIFKQGKIASMVGMEGGHSIDSSLGALRMFFDLGARYMTLTHGKNTPWADSATDTPVAGGLTKFGEAVVKEMNRLGMLVDLSHVSPDTMEDALRVSEAPVIFSHSSARAICDVPRNVPDNILKMLPKNGGVVMVTFVPGFISHAAAEWDTLADAEGERVRQQPGMTEEKARDAMREWRQAHPQPPVTIAQVADHIDHIRQVAGIDHIGIGSDFDGITTTPQGLEDVSRFPALTAELLRRGYSDADVKKIMGLNLLRAWHDVERVAAKLQKERGPSAATIEQLDGKKSE
ncbi:MAG: dipeptidase [Acidobacteriota bacterium]